MKKVLSIIMLALFMIIMAGCDEKLSEKGSIEQENMDISPKSVVGYVGDVMPFFDNGEMNIFYLQDERNTYLGFHPFALMTTTDFLSYNDYGKVIPYENDLFSPDLALGTGSVIKDKNGLYHCYYTGYNGNKSSGLPYFEKIQHATSTDKINWTKHPEDGFYGGANDFRDPYVYYSEDDGLYYMLITTRANDKGVIKQYKSSDLINWKDNGIFFSNDSGSYNMECPTFIEYNGYYYLTYSEQGSHRVTHYRYKKNINDPWIKPEVDFFDGEGLYAARLEKGYDKLYIFGWCGTKDGGFDNLGFDWAGNLVAHELHQLSDGRLNPKIVSEVDLKLSNKVEYRQTNGNKIEEYIYDSSQQIANVVEELSDNITKIEFDLTPNGLMGDCGLSFATIGPNVLSNLVLSFDFSKDQIAFYNDAKNFMNYNSAQIVVPYEFKANEDVKIKIIINDSVLTCYVDDTICLTARIYDMVGQKFSFYNNKSSSSIKNISFYE